MKSVTSNLLVPEQTLDRQITEPFRLGDLSRLESAAGRIGLAEAAGVLSGPGVVVVEPANWDVDAQAVAENLRQLPAVTVIAVDPALVPEAAGPILAAADVWLSLGPTAPEGWVVADLDQLVEMIAAHKLAAYALVSLTRASERMTLTEAVWAESASYSTLMGSRDYQGWLEAQIEARKAKPARERNEPDQAVLVEVSDAMVSITLNRPHVRNAVDLTLRDGLVAALELAETLPEADIELRGAGVCFSAGGDLSEFGQVDDPATAHAVRASRHPALSMARVGEKVTVYVHGTCVGAGVELMAFAAQVVAAEGATFRLPEIGMGMIPGAGGTCSLVRRLGRQRANWLMLSGVGIDTPRALEWGLVDEVVAG